MVRSRETYFDLNKTYYLVIIVDVSLSWEVHKFPFLLLASLITFIRFDTIRVYLKDKRKASHGTIMFP